MNKKVSIITVVRNNIDGLKKTYESIKDSLDNQVEWIVVDGHSTDGTIEFLRTFNSDSICWISERDRNMYDAMNKGIKLSKGEYLQFLNAGDVLEMRLQDSFLLHQNRADIVFYNIRKLDVKNKTISWSLPSNFLDHLRKYPSVPHQSTFIKNDVFIKIGNYCENYKYLGDYEFFCRVFHTSSYKPSYSYHLEITLVSFICDGITFNYRLSLKLLKECVQIQKIYFHKINMKTYLMYVAKYILSYFPKTLIISNYMRRYIKH